MNLLKVSVKKSHGFKMNALTSSKLAESLHLADVSFDVL